MAPRYHLRVVRFTLVLAAFLLPAAADIHAASAAETGPATGYGGVKLAPPVGYEGFKIQLAPIMSPYRTSSGVRYQVVTLRLMLNAGDTERPGCFMVPIIHEKFLMYFNKVQPAPADFVGQRKDVLAEELLKLAIATTDRSYFSGVEIVDDGMLARGEDKTTNLDPRSATLSTQCR